MQWIVGCLKLNVKHQRKKLSQVLSRLYEQPTKQPTLTADSYDYANKLVETVMETSQVMHFATIKNGQGIWEWNSLKKQI